MFSRNSDDTHKSCGLDPAKMRTLSDEALMNLLKQGQDDALAILFERYCRLVFSVAVKILRDSAEAEDVLQTVFMEIFQQKVQFDPAKGSTKVWFLQFAYHRSLNRLRYLKVRGLQRNAEIGNELEREAEDAFLLSQKTLDLVDRARMIRQGFRALTSAQRSTLKLVFFEGLSLKEVSERTGESLGNIRHHYYRGLDRMRSHLQGRYQPALETPVRGTAAFERGVVDAES